MSDKKLFNNHVLIRSHLAVNHVRVDGKTSPYAMATVSLTDFFYPQEEIVKVDAAEWPVLLKFLSLTTLVARIDSLLFRHRRCVFSEIAEGRQECHNW